MGINLHQDLIYKNHELWKGKPLLRTVYQDLYTQIAAQLSGLSDGKVVELGSGLGNIQDVIPHCIKTDLFPFPWIDQIENAYKLSFENDSVSDIILTDVFHHLKYPGTALDELWRVVRTGGRVIMLEPCISLLGLLVYGVFHAEPIAITKKIQWFAPEDWSAEEIDYYAAQGNATRIFICQSFRERLANWRSVKAFRISAIAYASSGGFSGPQLYPAFMLPLLKRVDKFLDRFPAVFSTRLLVILEK